MGGMFRKAIIFQLIFLLVGSATAQLIFRDGFEDGGSMDLPPNPEDIAPARAPGYITGPCEASSFLYDSLTPVQYNVDQAKIDCLFISVLSGRVLGRNDNPLPGVQVSVKDHPELGMTLTRTDGEYDLAVNGGGTLTLKFSSDGLLPAQRDVKPPPQSDLTLDDVILVGLDASVTTVQANQPAMQVVTATTSTDIDGSRTARLMIPSNTYIFMDDGAGGTDSVSTLDIRLTEYTVGPKGPLMMPAELPPTSGYTYAIEMSADQAPDKSITFSRPLASYNENFLGFPTGTIIPHGYLDRDLNQWVPADNGRVVEILTDSGDSVTLVIDASGVPASAPALLQLGINAEELAMLSQLYEPGDTLWRVPVTHFSPHDYNLPLPDDAVPPPFPPPLPEDFEVDTSDPRFGQIEFQTQTFQENLKLVGVPFSLHYSSDRTPGRSDGRNIRIPITRAVAPAGMSGVKLVTNVGGQRNEYVLGAQANQFFDINWDGKDRYGRPVFGTSSMSYEISYLFPAIYSVLNISNIGTEPARVFGALLSFPDSKTRSNLITTRPKTYRTRISGILDWRPLGVAGWSPSVHHFYDAVGGVVYKGDGTRQSDGGSSLSYTLNQWAGQGDDWESDGIPATQALISADQIAIASDGTVYFTEETTFEDELGEYISDFRIRAIDPDGTVRTVIPAGGSEYCSGPGSVAANDIKLGSWDYLSPEAVNPVQLAVDKNDQLYIAAATCPSAVFQENGEDFYPFFIFRVEADGSITPVLGKADLEFALNGNYSHVPSSEFSMVALNDLEFFPDGTLAILENYRFYRLEADNWIRRIGGTGSCYSVGCSPDGTPAIDAVIEAPVNMVTMPDGSLVFTGIQSIGSRRTTLRRITNGGILQTLIPGQDGRWYYTLTSAPDSTIYAVISTPGYPIRRRLVAIEPDGSTRIIAGEDIDQPYSSEGGLARQRRFQPYEIDIGPDGAIYGTTDGIERIVPGDEPVALADVLVASNSGPEVFRFSATGRHLDTRHVLTGGIIWEFAYDPQGFLTTVTDGYGNITNIGRAADGAPTSITSPDNHVTVLTVDAAGYLATSTTPGNAVASFEYSTQGLLQRVESATHDVYTMAYDTEGRLLSVTDPFSKTHTLSRTLVTGGSKVEVTTPTGLVTAYQRTVDDDRTVSSTTTGPAGLTSTRITETDGRVTTNRPDGVETVTTLAPDPRFGMQSPYAALMTVAFPGGTVETQQQLRASTLQNTGNILDLLTFTQTVTLGSEVTSMVFDGTSNQQTLTTPTGITETATVDEHGTFVSRTGTGVPKLVSVLDGRGRMTRIDMGEGANERSTLLEYDGDGLLNRLTTANGLEAENTYDADLRLVEVLLPDGESQYSGFDASGFEVSVAPPGGAPVLLTPDARKNLASITYPDAGSGPAQTLFGYDDDKRSVAETRANGTVLSNTFNNLGQLTTVGYSGGQLSYGYDLASGLKTQIAAPNVTLDRIFDGPWLAQESWSGSVAGGVERQMDTNRVRSKTVSVNGTDSISYSYTPLLTKVGSMDMTYDPANDQIATTSIGLVTDEYHYDAESRLESYTAKISGLDYYSYDLTYDVMSRITDIAETMSGIGHVHTFSYDDRGNLESVDIDAVNVSGFVYDSRGNRTGVTSGMSTTDATYDAQDRQLTRGAYAFDYDEDGMLTSQTVAVDTTSYVYDEFSNLLRVTLPDGRDIDYVVDGVHRRMERTIDGVRTAAWLFENNRIVAELDIANSVTSRFVYATFNGAPDYMIRSARTYRFIKDHLGSVRAVIDVGDGNIAQEISYDAWGQITGDTNPGFQPFGFGGGIYDPLSGLTRFGARDYSAASGRWTTRDPIGFSGGSTNLYCYVGNDPVNLTDESGLVAPLLVAALWGLGAAAISENVALATDSSVAGLAVGTPLNGIASGQTGGAGPMTVLRNAAVAYGEGGIAGGIKAGLGSLGRAVPFYVAGKALGWGARIAGRNSVDEVSASADTFGIDRSQLTIGEQQALDELMRRYNENDGTDHDELEEIVQRLSVLKNRANARRKGL